MRTQTLHLDASPLAPSFLAQYAAMAGCAQTGPVRPDTERTRMPRLTPPNRERMAKASAEARNSARRLKVNVPNPGTGRSGGGR